MGNCCQSNSETFLKNISCPNCQSIGKGVQIIAIKSLLIPTALTRLHADTIYSFCPSENGEVVYFSGSDT
ncbi:hypothetical protein ACQKK5_10980 [Brevibacillus panacihumi]|uniref:hypothetical protein n=1 Tax=Brevibacillus panacihumi TaxID=497735 RepID=UPI003D082308